MQKSREELAKMTCKELAYICKKEGIKHYEGKKIFSKKMLLDAILNSGKQIEFEIESDVVEEQDLGQVTEEVTLSEEQKKQKIERYIKDAPIGSLVAFKEESCKVNTAMIVKRHKTKPMFILETKYQKQFQVTYDDILWVKSEGGHWPKGIFLLLKGGKTNANNDQ